MRAPAFRPNPIRSIKGKIIGANSAEPQEGVLVEVYPVAGWPPEQGRFYDYPDCSERLVVCVTGESGEFAFVLPSGEYELRTSSLLPGNAEEIYHTRSVIVIIDAESGKAEELIGRTGTF